jgi:hypothetical protein
MKYSVRYSKNANTDIFIGKGGSKIVRAQYRGCEVNYKVKTDKRTYRMKAMILHDKSKKGPICAPHGGRAKWGSIFVCGLYPFKGPLLFKVVKILNRGDLKWVTKNFYDKIMLK